MTSKHNLQIGSGFKFSLSFDNIVVQEKKNQNEFYQTERINTYKIFQSV